MPPGHVLVIDCRGETRVASGGQILTTRLKVRGAAGLVSDGPVRDSGAIAAMDFPVYCAGGSAPLNLIHHHAIDLNVPIGCGGVAVYPGDIIVGDDEGVVVIPRHLADEVAATPPSRRSWRSSCSSASRPARRCRAPIRRMRRRARPTRSGARSATLTLATLPEPRQRPRRRFA